MRGWDAIQCDGMDGYESFWCFIFFFAKLMSMLI